jgi:hypothetical protein
MLNVPSVSLFHVFAKSCKPETIILEKLDEDAPSFSMIVSGLHDFAKT